MHPVIVDLAANDLQRADIELENTGADRSYVVVEPARIDSPGLPTETRVINPDPQLTGLLASPNKLILEPGERRFIRIAALAPAGAQDRIFRVAIRPVAGEVRGEHSGLKVLVGYDVLVIQRPVQPDGTLRWSREKDGLSVTNNGNTNVELIRGRACAPGQAAAACPALPPRRIYSGQTAMIPVAAGAKPIYTVKVANKLTERTFDTDPGAD